MINKELVYRWAPIVISGFALLVSIKACNQQDVSNQLSAIMTNNSNKEIEIAQKKLSFDIINTLYTDFYQFDTHNSLLIRKLQNRDIIQDEFNLALYLSGFEDLYQQCKTGLITKEDIRINFEHLIRPTCNNEQIAKVLGERGNGLKMLCYKFYEGSKLANLAEKKELDSCH